ncbi:hypothetical protein [Borreliella burgdorferi]|uniref:Uncharacterized protein n=1 Tax=Borreliella carolinensis TaxID=478174 RepID=A0ACD5GKK8_9SPIR
MISSSDLNDWVDEVVFKNCKEKINLLKEDRKYANNAKKFEEKFFNLQKNFKKN